MVVWFGLLRSVKEASLLASIEERGSAALKVEAEMKRAIVALELKPGLRLSEADVVEHV